jgi:hypothetical protein
MTVPRRRWFAFSLRTLFVGVTLASLAAYLAAWNVGGPEISISDAEASLSQSDRGDISRLIRDSKVFKRTTFVRVTVMEPGAVLAEAGSKSGLIYEVSASMTKTTGAWKVESIRVGD